MPEIVILSIIVLFASLATSIILNKLFIKYGKKAEVGGGDRATSPEDFGRHIHVRPIGRQGGIAIFLTLAIIIGGGTLVGWVFAHIGPIKETIWLEKITQTVAGAREVIPQILALFLSASSVFLLGVLDDKRGVGWKVKLPVQMGAALALTLVGLRPSFFSFIPGLDYAVGIFWIVGVTNAFNFIDGMDGLCAGVAAIAVGILAFFMSAYNHPLILMFLVALLGALLGFLKYNFYPAKIFMGDGGSTLIGFFLAAITLQASYTTISTKTILPFLMPIFILAIPLYDSTSVILIRLKNRRSPFCADTNHLHHRLKRTGMTDKQSVLFIYLMVFAVGINSTLLTQVDNLGGMVVLTQMLAVLGLFVILERIIRKEVIAQDVANGCTDRLFSVEARFSIVPSTNEYVSEEYCESRQGVVRELGEETCSLFPIEPLNGIDIEGLMQERNHLSVSLTLEGNGEPVTSIHSTFSLRAIEHVEIGLQKLKLDLKKISQEDRIRLNEFIERMRKSI